LFIVVNIVNISLIASIDIRFIALQYEVLQVTKMKWNLSSAISSRIFLAEAFAFIRGIVFVADILIMTI